MLGKRNFVLEDELVGDEVPVQESKRQLTFESAVRHVMRSLSMQEHVSNLEPFLRRVVREEVERVLDSYMHSSSRPTLNRFGASESRGWRLHFVNKLPNTIFTCNRIKSEDNEAIKIVLFDPSSGMIVTTGPLSSLKVEILVLNGDFGSDDEEDWDETDFDSSVICEREGRRPLITGELHVTLKDGVGEIGDITLTDNSSWTRSRTFRLGARAIRGTCHTERVREARSGAFVVKDHRGESYKKHYPPSLNDEVWRLERISKDGVLHRTLGARGIETVQDLLRLFNRDPCSLHATLGNGMSKKKWDAIIRHATSCTLDNKRYLYHKTGQQVGLLFDSIYKVVGATFDGCNFVSVDNLSSYQMSLVEMVKRDAYQNPNDVSEIVCPMIDAPSTALQLPNVSSEGLSLDEQVSCFQVAQQESLANGATSQVSLICPPHSISCVLEDNTPSEDVATTQHYHPLQSSLRGNSFREGGLLSNYIDDGNEWIQDGSLGAVVLDGNCDGQAISQMQMSNLLASWEQGIDPFTSLPDFGIYKPNMGWFKLRAAFKSVRPFRQGLAMRRAIVSDY